MCRTLLKLLLLVTALASALLNGSPVGRLGLHDSRTAAGPQNLFSFSVLLRLPTCRPSEPLRLGIVPLLALRSVSHSKLRAGRQGQQKRPALDPFTDRAFAVDDMVAEGPLSRIR